MFLSGCCICDADIGFSSAFTTPLTIRDSLFKHCIYNHRTTKTNQKYPSVNL